MLALLVSAAHAVLPPGARAEVVCDDGNAVALDGCTDRRLGARFVQAGFDREEAHAAVFADGSSVVVYTEYGDVKAARYDADGTAVGAPILVADVNDAYDPKVAALADGSWVVTWQHGVNSVRFQKYLPDDRPRGSAVDLGAGIEPTVAATPDGGFVVLWGSSALYGQWRFQHLRLDGSTVVGPVLLPDLAGSADIAVKPDGSFLVASHIAGPSVVVDHYAPDGSDLGLGGWGTGGYEPAVAVTTSGEIVVAYRGSFSNSIYVRRLAPDGSALSDELVSGPGENRDPDLAVAPDGSFAVTWSDSTELRWQASIRTFEADGAPRGDARELGRGALEDHRNAAVAAAPDATFLVAWETDAASGGVLGAWVDPDGVTMPWTTPRTRPLHLVQGPLRRGRDVLFGVSGAAPGEDIALVRGALGVPSCPVVMGGVCLDVSGPVVLGTATADATGTAIVRLPLPAGAPLGLEVATQAVAVRGAGGADSVVSRALVDTVSN